MPQQYDNTNSGALFKNDRKESDKHPDYKGQGNFKGEEVWIAAWLKKSKAGQTFMSLSFTPKDESQQRQSSGGDIGDNDVPF